MRPSSTILSSHCFLVWGDVQRHFNQRYLPKHIHFRLPPTYYTVLKTIRIKVVSTRWYTFWHEKHAPFDFVNQFCDMQEFTCSRAEKKQRMGEEMDRSLYMREKKLRDT